MTFKQGYLLLIIILNNITNSTGKQLKTVTRIYKEVNTYNSAAVIYNYYSSISLKVRLTELTDAS